MKTHQASKTDSRQVMKNRQQMLAEFEELIQDLEKGEYRLKRRPTDYNETRYVVSLSQEFLHPLAEIYAGIGPGDDGIVRVNMLGTILQQRTIRFLEDNITDQDLRKELINCLKSKLPRPAAEKPLQEYLQKKTGKFRFVKIEVSP